jgi:uncharacterized protein
MARRSWVCRVASPGSTGTTRRGIGLPISSSTQSPPTGSHPLRPTSCCARGIRTSSRNPGASRTRVTDRVQTQLGSHLLRPMFIYRHRQLADDLAAHRWATESGSRSATIAVTGASGLVGSALCAFLTSGGHRVIRLVRRQARGDDERRWDPMRPDPALLEGTDALVHLAGESIAGRFTPAHKRAIRDSRVEPTLLLCNLAATTHSGPRIMVVASAIGYYGADRGDEILSEDSGPGDSFLANVVADWEAATRRAAEDGIRVTNVRTGLVQSPRGDTLRLFRPLFSLGLGGRISTGRQWVSWIDLDDLVDIYNRALFDTNLSGPVNAVAPAPVRNRDYARTLARVLKRPALLPVPDLGPRLILGMKAPANSPKPARTSSHQDFSTWDITSGMPTSRTRCDTNWDVPRAEPRDLTGQSWGTRIRT